MTRLTTIAIADGVTATLEGDGADRNMREAAAETKRQACRDCSHHLNAHKTGNCTTLVIPADKSWSIANAKKCGCASQKKTGRAAA